jgi:hypothetical protein
MDSRPATLIDGVARSAVVVAVAVIAASCGGSAKPQPFNQRTLVSESAAAARAAGSARVKVVIAARVLHSQPLPSGMAAGPYSITVAGAFTAGADPVFTAVVRLSEPGATVSTDVRSTGSVLYLRPPGGRWYSLALGPGGTNGGSRSAAQRGLARLLGEEARGWPIDVGVRRARSRDILSGDIDMGAVGRDLGPLASRLRMPAGDAGLLEYLAGFVDDPSWRLTFDHTTHLLRGVRALDEIDFNSLERKELHQPMPLGIPYQVDGVSLALTAHVDDWGAHVHVTAPHGATPLALPQASAIANRGATRAKHRPRRTA